MSYLNFIDDATLEKIVKFVLDKGRTAMIKAEKQFDRNVVDPFSIIFEMASFKVYLQQNCITLSNFFVSIKFIL
ncbi:Eco47II family restriction endonuclease [Candidatus Tisiphia endosymbiont of Hybos culiciformis]|uniref:Eco47II family restriction endonuclease n=1 Tax=Candidatus Tisiphia endosymbiont of Hybos culiciformis TaxID=3139331 RepID=UPI003CCAA2B1